MRTTYISSKKAAEIDERLMSGDYGHTLTQLMELAGLAVAKAVADFAPERRERICVVCGPGNNGGDGLVAARHLRHYGYDVRVWYPKVRRQEPFVGLRRQLEALQVDVCEDMGEGAGQVLEATVLVDAIFGFSFDGREGVRSPFDAVIARINEAEGRVVAVDVPSGWDVDSGDGENGANGVNRVAALVSLSAPKLCALKVERAGGAHYVGGRFIPPKLCDELGFNIVEYKGAEDIVRLQ